MTVDHMRYQQLQVEKMQLVQSMTKLNSQHIQSQSRLSGIEIDTARCKEAMQRGDENAEIELQQLDKQAEEIMKSRIAIESNRIELERKINEIDSELANSME